MAHFEKIELANQLQLQSQKMDVVEQEAAALRNLLSKATSAAGPHRDSTKRKAMWKAQVAVTQAKSRATLFEIRMDMSSLKENIRALSFGLLVPCLEELSQVFQSFGAQLREAESRREAAESRLSSVVQQLRQAQQHAEGVGLSAAAGHGTIQVIGRVRQPLDYERDASLHFPDDLGTSGVAFTLPSGERRDFELHKLFRPECKQIDYFTSVIAPQIASLFRCGQLLFVACGPAGGGKTYTLEGDGNEPGVVYHTLSMIMSMLRNTHPSVQPRLEVGVSDIRDEKVADIVFSGVKSYLKHARADIVRTPRGNVVRMTPESNLDAVLHFLHSGSVVCRASRKAEGMPQCDNIAGVYACARRCLHVALPCCSAPLEYLASAVLNPSPASRCSDTPRRVGRRLDSRCCFQCP
jgi:hypothetical protein